LEDLSIEKDDLLVFVTKEMTEESVIECLLHRVYQKGKADAESNIQEKLSNILYC
jgi:hypothetical protein